MMKEMKIVTYSIKNLIEQRESAQLNNFQLGNKMPHTDASYLSKLQSGKIKRTKLMTIRKIGFALGVVFVMGHPDGSLVMFNSESLKFLRNNQGLSLVDLSNESGCGYRCIYKIERGMVNDNYVYTDTVSKLGETLGVRFY